MGLKYEQQMKKGVLEMLVLKLLAKEEKYGYQLISELKDKSDGLFLLKEGTLYPILYRLEDEGLVECYWSKPGDREVSRKYYAITGKGQKQLNDMIQVWERFFVQVEAILDEEEQTDGNSLCQ